MNRISYSAVGSVFICLHGVATAQPTFGVQSTNEFRPSDRVFVYEYSVENPLENSLDGDLDLFIDFTVEVPATAGLSSIVSPDGWDVIHSNGDLQVEWAASSFESALAPDESLTFGFSSLLEPGETIFSLLIISDLSGVGDVHVEVGQVDGPTVADEVPGDCNGDGVVSAADLQCACSSGALEDVLAGTGLLLGDLDGDGVVAFADFLFLSANFGKQVGGYDDGDIDCSGDVAFVDFLALSANFGKTVSRAVAVPEPSSSLIVAVVIWAMMMPGRRARR